MLPIAAINTVNNIQLIATCVIDDMAYFPVHAFQLFDYNCRKPRIAITAL